MRARKRPKRIARARPPRRKVPAGPKAEIASLKRALSEALEQQTATSEVLQVISSSPGELEPVFQTMLANATRICEAKFGILYRYDDGEFEPAAIHNVSDAHAEFLQRRGRFRPPLGTPLDRLVKAERLVQTADEAAEPMPGSPARLGGARSLVAVPMRNASSLVGAFVIYRQEVRSFTEKQIELVQSFAAQAVIAIENTRLLNELRESLQQQTATADVLKVISRSPTNIQPVLDAVGENAARLCEANNAVIFRLEDGLLRQVAAYGHIPTSSHADAGLPINRDTVTGRAVFERQTIHVHDLAAEENEYPEGSKHARIVGHRTTLATPMLREGVPIGVILIRRMEVRPFSQKQIELVTTFADQAAIAIENVRLFNETKEALEQQTATSEVLKVISSSPGTLQPVFEAMLANATRLCEASYGVMWLREGGGFRSAALHGPLPAAYIEQWRSGTLVHAGPDAPMMRVAETRQPVQVPDMRESRAYLSGDPLPVAAVEVAGIRTLLSVPMFKQDELVGAITIYRKEVRPFTDKQIALVTNFAAQAVIAIENTRLLNELRQRTDDLSEALEQQTATSEVLGVISSSPGELEPVFQAMLANAVRICGASFGVLFRFEDGAWRAPAMFGVPPAFAEFWQRGPQRPGPRTALGRVAETRQAVHVVDVTKESAYVEGEPIFVAAVNLGRFRTILTVPMLEENELIGAFAIYRQEVRSFTDKQIELVRNFAAQAVIAIENTRLLNQLRESLQQQTATADILKVISRSTFELQPVFNSMAESAVRLCEAERAYIFRFDGQVLRAVASFNAGTENQDWVYRNPIPLGRHSVSARAGLERRTVQVADIQADPEYSYVARDVDPIRTTLAVPMLKGDELIGTITIYRLEVKPFTENQIALMETFAAQAVIAIENARLFENVQTRTRELAQSLEELQTTQDRLVQTQKLASLGQLTAGIAHEIKNPLNFVNNFSSLSTELLGELQDSLRRGQFDEKTRAEIDELTDTLRANLDKIEQHGKRADSIVKNMLLHSREDSGDHRPLDINAVVEESLNLAYHGARAEKQGFNITLERAFDPAAGEVDVFPQEITRVLLNLISNGFYAASKRKAETGDDGGYEPTLSASTKNLGDRVEIRIRDNGTGIPPEVKDKMFNPFFTTKPPGEGTGLGLSLSHDIIVKQHAGLIEVDTKPGEFTEFRIILSRTAASIAKTGGRA